MKQRFTPAPEEAMMMASTSLPTPPVLTREGRAWLTERRDRAASRLTQLDAELAVERSDELIAEHRALTAQAEELSQLLRDAIAPGQGGQDPDVVELGDEVELAFPDGERETVLLVHPMEAGLDERRTSADSPLARAVLGARPGDRVTVTAPAGVYHVTVISTRRQV